MPGARAVLGSQAEGADGMRAVASVVLNRVAHPEFPDTVCAVVKEGGEQPPCQFSWWCDGKSDRPTETAAWQLAQSLARRRLSKPPRDPTRGALFFHNSSIDDPLACASASARCRSAGTSSIADAPAAGARRTPPPSPTLADRVDQTISGGGLTTSVELDRRDHHLTAGQRAVAGRGDLVDVGDELAVARQRRRQQVEVAAAVVEHLEALQRAGLEVLDEDVEAVAVAVVVDQIAGGAAEGDQAAVVGDRRAVRGAVAEARRRRSG